MAIDLNDIQTFTDAQILLVLRASLVSSAIASQYSIGGRQIIRMSGTQIQALIDVYEQRVSAAAVEGGGGDVLVRFGEPQ